MTRLLRRLRGVSPCRCRAAGARWRGAPFKGRAAPRSGDFKEFPALLCDRGRLRQNGRCTLQQPHAASSSASQVRSAALSALRSHRRPTKTRRQNASWTQSTQKCPKSEAPMKNKKKIASLFFFFQLPSFCFPSPYIRCCRKMFFYTMGKHRLAVTGNHEVQGKMAAAGHSKGLSGQEYPFSHSSPASQKNTRT